MSYVRVQESTFNNPMKSIVAIPDHYVAITGKMAATHAVNVDGVKTIKAGTCVKGLATRNNLTPVSDATDKFEGVVFHDETVAPGETEVNVTILIHGFVRGGALVKVKQSSSVATPTVPVSGTDLIVVL